MLRLRYRELTPAAFFLKTTGGRLTQDLLSEHGARFAEHQYAVYRSENRAMLLGGKGRLGYVRRDCTGPDEGVLRVWRRRRKEAGRTLVERVAMTAGA